MEIQQLSEISERLYENIQSLSHSDISTLKKIIDMTSISYGKIRTFSLEDSQTIILYTLKLNVLIMLKYLLENHVEIDETLLDSAYTLIDTKSKILTGSTGTQNIDLQAQIEKERVAESIQNVIIDLVYLSNYTGKSIISYLENRKIPDEVSVNLAVAVSSDLELGSFELTVLSKKIIGPVLLSLVKSYKATMRTATKDKIIESITPSLASKDKEIAFEIFYLLNQNSNSSLLSSIKVENTPEYFGFVSSLVKDKESAEIAFTKLEPFFEDLEGALQTLLTLHRVEEKAIHPNDLKMMCNLLECIKSISSFKVYNFYKFLSIFQGILKIKVDRKIKGLIYDILSKYVREKDIYISKTIECRDQIEKEIKTKDFYLLPRLIKFLNAYQRREEAEIESISNGNSIGSPYVTNDMTLGLYSDKHDYRILGFKSEDPDTIIECLDCFIQPQVIKLNAAHLRHAMIKDVRVIEKMIDYQIFYSCVIDDISIVSAILAHSSTKFFEYAKLFSDFTPFLNADVLERIGDDIEHGIQWIKDNYNRNFGSFIIRNSSYFNELLRKNKNIQKSILPVYERVLDENFGEVDFALFSAQKNDNKFSTLLVHDDQDHITPEFFRIFSKLLIFNTFYKNKTDQSEKPILGRMAIADYEIYIKSKAVCGLDVSQDVDFMKSNLLECDSLLGYLKVAGKIKIDDLEVQSSDVLMNFGIKDNGFFLKKFRTSNDFEKFLLFFNIEHVSKEIDSIIKEEVMKNYKNPNKLYFRICAMQLFRTKDLDHLLRVLEQNFEDRSLLFRLNLHNIVSGGKYFSKNIFEYGDQNLKGKALMLLYYLGIWDKGYIMEIVNKIGADTSEELKFISEDYKRY